MSRLEKAFGVVELGAGMHVFLTAMVLMGGADIGFPTELLEQTEGADPMPEGYLQPTARLTNNAIGETIMAAVGTGVMFDGVRRIVR